MCVCARARVRACVRAGVRACVRACVRVCVCVSARATACVRMREGLVHDDSKSFVVPRPPALDPPLEMIDKYINKIISYVEDEMSSTE